MPELGEVPVTEKQKVNGKLNSNSLSATVEDPGYVDLAKKYGYKAYTVLTQEFVLYRIATAKCLSERVFWALIFTSCCGPDVREGCFVRKKKTGDLVRDANERLYPIRVRHLLDILDLDQENRGNVHNVIKKLIAQNFIEERGPEKIWYLVLDRAKLKALAENYIRPGYRWYGKYSNAPYSFLPRFLQKAIPPEVVSSNTINPITKTWLENHKAAYKNALRELRERYAADAKSHFSAGASFITEDLEDKEEESEGSVSNKPVEEPKPAVAPLPPPSQPSAAIAVQDLEREHRWDVLCEIFKGCGKPISIHRATACRAEFFKRPPPVQQRIVEDAFIRSESAWDKPQFTTDPLKYLRSDIWDIEPIKRRTLPRTKNTAEQERLDALRRAYERAIRLDEELGPLP